LEHENHSTHKLQLTQDGNEQGSRDVVRQVADQNERLGIRAKHLLEIETEHISGMHLGTRAVFFFQCGRKITIDFHQVKLWRARHEMSSQRTAPGTNLDHGVLWRDDCRFDNPAGNPSVGEKVLPKTLAGPIQSSAPALFGSVSDTFVVKVW